MMTIKKKRLIIIMISIVIIVTAGVIALIILSQNMNLFKSQEAVVKEYLGQVFDKFTNVINFDYEKQIYSSLENSIYESNTEIILNNKKKDSKLKLVSESEVDNLDEYKYNYTKLSYGEETIAEVEYLRQDEIIGIRLTNLIKQFVSIKNENLDELAQNIEIFDTENYTLPEKIENINILKEIEISEEEKNILKEKYIDIIYKNLSNKEITKQKNSMVTVSEQTVNANAYTVTISKTELDNIYIEILENLKSDEIILNKVSNIEKICEEYIINQENTVKDYYIDMLEDKINEIKDNQEEYEIKFTLYEVNDSVVKVSIEHNFRKINLELASSNEIIINDLIMGETENTKQIIINKNKGQLKITVTTLIGEEETEFSIEENITGEDKNIKMEISVTYNKNEENALYINNNIKIVDEIEEKYDVEKDNIILSDLNEKNLNKIVNKVVNVIKEEFPERLKILQNSLDINIIGDMVISEDGKTESEKNIFNAKFEFYAGENISKENVEKLLEVVKQNLESIEINKEQLEEQSENKEIRLKIKENSKYEESFEEIEKILEKSKTYKVKIEYNKDTEIVEYITITTSENN